MQVSPLLLIQHLCSTFPKYSSIVPFGLPWVGWAQALKTKENCYLMHSYRLCPAPFTTGSPNWNWVTAKHSPRQGPPPQRRPLSRSFPSAPGILLYKIEVTPFSKNENSNRISDYQIQLFWIRKILLFWNFGAALKPCSDLMISFKNCIWMRIAIFCQKELFIFHLLSHCSVRQYNIFLM